MAEHSWRYEAACEDEDTEIFFPVRNRHTYKTIAAQAKQFCHGDGDQRPVCPVIRDCLWMAIRDDEEHGILGGMSHRERNALVRKWQKKYRHEMTLQEFILESEGSEPWQQRQQLDSTATN
jgi:hypothetical protein